MTHMWELSVKDFGPIREGTVKLRPLTIFIGANNTGKSYLAQVAYALGGLLPSPSVAVKWRPYPWPLIDVKLDPKGLHVIAELRRAREYLLIDELPEEVRAVFARRIDEFFEDLFKLATSELQRCFGCPVNELTRWTASSFSITLSQISPPTKFLVHLKDQELQIREKEWSGEIEIREAEFLPEPNGSVLVFPVSPRDTDFFWSQTRYLPASRSGILQWHKALAGSFISRLPLVGIERVETPKLSGIVADFLRHLLVIERRKRDCPVAAVADFLETQICRGRIQLERAEPEAGYPELYYRQEDLKLPLYRASSMVSELAPIVLFLRYVVDEGDLLIIEEPEAHLHPDHQLSLARGIARLVRQGVQVLVTTHSDYFLHQISNLVQASAADQDTKTSLKYLEEEQLRAEEVGVYLFKANGTESGTTVEELKVTVEDGIPQDEFVRIAEQLYHETVRLDHTYSRRQ